MIAFRKQGPRTHPGKHAALFEALPDGICALVDATRGLFVHCDSLNLYGLGDGTCPAMSRKTLTVEDRLDRIVAAAADPLTVARRPACREVGTCRDYALMVCAMLRHKGVPARVRCGFARYFSTGRFEDHWICEYWHACDKRWARADAQLDDPHCTHLGIGFDTCDLPDGEFLTAHEAWRSVRENGTDPDLFGHGSVVGEWFLRVNLARDCLSLGGREVSEWDGWRQAVVRRPVLSSNERTVCDEIADRIRTTGQTGQTVSAGLDLVPFWMDKDDGNGLRPCHGDRSGPRTDWRTGARRAN